MINIDKQALREEFQCMQDHYSDPADRARQVIYIAAEALLDELEAAEKQIVELSRVANVNNQWKPEVCPVTGRQFFMWIEHPDLGYVPTYGGPFDSYTIPTRGSDGEFSRERYDHDFGGWREGECTGLYLTDGDEQCRVHELEQHIAELEAREVTLPAQRFCPGEYVGSVLWAETEIWNKAISACDFAVRAAGIKVKGGGEHENR